jgi:hypothetical protein
MYQVSCKGLCEMDYWNEVQGFINYAYLIQKILVNGVLNIHVKGVKIKSF